MVDDQRVAIIFDCIYLIIRSYYSKFDLMHGFPNVYHESILPQLVILNYLHSSEFNIEVERRFQIRLHYLCHDICFFTYVINLFQVVINFLSVEKQNILVAHNRIEHFRLFVLKLPNFLIITNFFTIFWPRCHLPRSLLRFFNIFSFDARSRSDLHQTNICGGTSCCPSFKHFLCWGNELENIVLADQRLEEALSKVRRVFSNILLLDRRRLHVRLNLAAHYAAWASDSIANLEPRCWLG